jgi:hypothetical protein
MVLKTRPPITLIIERHLTHSSSIASVPMSETRALLCDAAIVYINDRYREEGVP